MCFVRHNGSSNSSSNGLAMIRTMPRPWSGRANASRTSERSFDFARRAGWNELAANTQSEPGRASLVW
jgi:hypothetical protein